MSRVLRGIGVSPGVAHGRVVHMPEVEPVAIGVAASVSASELSPEISVREPMEATARDLDERAATVGGQAADVLKAQAMMARDPELAKEAEKLVTAGYSPAQAVSDAFGLYRSLLAAAGEYIGARVVDLDDVRERVLARLLGRPHAAIPDPGFPFILVARDLPPAEAAILDPQRVVGLVTEEGSPTSHTAIVARAYGVPAVVACPGAVALDPGLEVLLDGSSGVVITEPEAAQVDSYRQQAGSRRTKIEIARGTGRTADGHRVPLLANIGNTGDVSAAVDVGAEGVGLLRTEFLFLGRSELPTLTEQAETYRAVLAAFPTGRVVIRTLDAGSDKPLPSLNVAGEVNPALGVRGWRATRVHLGVLECQLDAIERQPETPPLRCG